MMRIKTLCTVMFALSLTERIPSIKTKNAEITEIDPVKCQKEWQELKGVFLAEKYPRDKSNALWQLIQKCHGSDFPEMIKLGQLYFTLAVHTAGCERGFSV